MTIDICSRYFPYTNKGTWSLNDATAQIVNSEWVSSLIDDVPGCLFSWGSNSCGQIGDATIIFRSSPTQIAGTTWMRVTAGDCHFAAIKNDGTLWTWGNNDNGQLGNNQQGVNFCRSSPIQVPGSTWINLSTGRDHTTAIANVNEAYSWGLNSVGQLGVHDTNPRSSPTLIPGTRCWMKVCAGANHVVMKSSNNCIWSFGNNQYGQLGLNDLTPRCSPVAIGAQNTWSDFSTYGDTSYGIRCC